MAIIAALVVANAGAYRSTVEGANYAGGDVSYNEKFAPYTMLYWGDSRAGTKEGENKLKILIFDGVNDGEHGEEGSSSTETDYALDRGYAKDENDEIVYQYNAITWRNGTIEFSIQDVLYDLTKGSLFLIRTRNGNGVDVQQVYADLSNVVPLVLVPEGESNVQEFAETNEDVLSFLRELEEVIDASRISYG